jgi:hypothetical protein
MGAGLAVVSGMVAATPGQGGATWAVLQYVLGLRRLGWEVVFVEPVASPAGPGGVGVEYCREVMDRHGVDRWALLDDTTGEAFGMERATLLEAVSGADIIINVSGMLADVDVLEHIPVRVYLDLDPVFVQLWHAVEGVDMRLDAHTHFVTIGSTIGEAGSPVPDCGRSWIATLPPVVLEHWPVADQRVEPALTTIAHWRGYGSVDHDGVHYGQKAHSLRPLFGLPRQVPVPFRLALAIHPDEVDDVDALRENCWEVVDPGALVATPDDYRRFVQQSWAEFGLAKSGYVVSRSGWFSDRSACYLASGRPVIAQDTGFSSRLPVGEGLFAFTSADDVAGAVEELLADYPRHRVAARRIAEAHLDSDDVLQRLIDEVGS